MPRHPLPLIKLSKQKAQFFLPKIATPIHSLEKGIFDCEEGRDVVAVAVEVCGVVVVVVAVVVSARGSARSDTYLFSCFRT